MADREGPGPAAGAGGSGSGSMPTVPALLPPLPPLPSQTMPMMLVPRGHTTMVHPHPTPIRAPPPPFHVQSPGMVHPSYAGSGPSLQPPVAPPQQPTPFAQPASFASSTMQQQRNQMNPMAGVVSGPRIVILHRHNGDFGFTLRHFIVYPPDSVTEASTSTIPGVGILNFVHPMDTVFVKKVHQNTPAHLAGLQEGDRLLAVNGVPVTSIPYSQVVATIQQTPKTLTLQVVPKNFDILQTFFSETAHNPETNQRPQPPVYAPRMTHPKVKQPQAGALLSVAGVQEKQESLYSALQEIVTVDSIGGRKATGDAMDSNSSSKHAIYAEVPKLVSNSNSSNNSSSSSSNSNQMPVPNQLTVKGPSTAVARQPSPSSVESDTLYQHQQQQHQYLSKQYQSLQQQQQQQKQHEQSEYASMRETSASYVALGDGDSAIMSRLRKSLEQKEEFLRRPVPTVPAAESDGLARTRSTGRGAAGEEALAAAAAAAAAAAVPATTATIPASRPSVPPKPTSGDVQQREFYGRPNRLQKSVWPPTTATATNGGLRPLAPPAPTPPSSSSSSSSSSSTASGTLSPNATIKSSAGTTQPSHASNRSAIRELFFTGGEVRGSSKGLERGGAPSTVPNGGGRLPTDRHSEPLHLTMPSEQLFDDSTSGMSGTVGGGGSGGGAGALPLSAHTLHAVSEKAKLFESGRPLSPEGIDRMDLYKSELSRINTKQVVPNVAVRRREFELKAESTGWCRSTDEQTPSVCSDSDSTHKTTGGRVRSLSVESTPSQSELMAKVARTALSPPPPPRDSSIGPSPGSEYVRAEKPLPPEHSPAITTTSALASPAGGGPDSSTPVPAVAILRQKPNRDDSYRNVVCSSTDGLGPPIILRPKQQPSQQQQPMEEDERKMRRISYLKATASDNLFQMLEGDTGESGTAQLPVTGATPTGSVGSEADTAANTTDCFLPTKPDNQSTTTTTTTATTATVKMQTTSTMTTGTSIGSYTTTQQPQLKSHGSKSKALAHFRDNPADSSEPVVRAGELHIKVTTIDGKRSVDRSWRQVHAELRGTRLKLTLLRDGKASAQSPEPAGTIDLTNFHVSEGNYTKRKNVFRLATTTTTGSYCPLEAVGAAGGGVTGGFHPHTEVHRTQSTSGLASTDVTMMSTAASAGAAPDREILVQADSASDMQQWMEALRSVCIGDGDGDGVVGTEGRTPDTTDQPLRSQDYLKSLGGQQAEPQRVAALTSVQLPSGGNSGDDYSPILPTKAQRKYALGTRSPSGQSPVTKSRKTPGERCSSPTAAMLPSTAATPAMPIRDHHQTSQHPYHQLTTYQQQQQQGHTSGGSDRENGSPKSKTWKGIVARQFRKMQGQPPSSAGCQHQYPHHLQHQHPQQQQQQQQQQQEQAQHELLPFSDSGASINVPLQHCPMSEEHPYVPLVLAKCTGVVESRGLGVVGIYRIPGNTAAIAQLTDTINRGLDETALQDPRWEDVNVVSSLLKSFIRNLPEPLLPNALYGGFIAADKLGGQRRLIELRQLLHRIPRLHYETLKHLLRHLHRVSAHSEVNLMDPRNLAIVFGPSVVRSANESLETAVKDMRHQCQIVEVLINYYQYFFEDGPLPTVDEKPNGSSAVDSPMEVPTTTLLLDNVSKIEPFKDAGNKDTTAGFVANIVQAANRKIRRTAQRKSTMSSTTPDTLSLDSTTSAESKEQSMRSITRSRYMEMGSGATGSTTSATTSRRAAPGGSLSEDQADSETRHGTVAMPVAVAATAGLALGDGAPVAPLPMPRHRSAGGAVVPMEESLLQLHHHHHHHHHYYHSNRHHSSQSNDDASIVLNRSSEDDSNDSAFADNGSMSLKTVTIALDNKLRSLRNSSIDSDRDNTLDSEGELSSSCCSATMLVEAGNLRHSLHQKYQLGRTQRPLTLGGENIPYADESPERPLVQGRAAKPGSTSDNQHGGGRGTPNRSTGDNNNDDNGNSSNANNNNNNNSSDGINGCTRTNASGNESGCNSKQPAASQNSTSNTYARSNTKSSSGSKNNNNNHEESSLTGQNRVQQAAMQRKGPAQQRSTDGSGGSSGTSSTNNSCLTLVNEVNSHGHVEEVVQGGNGRDVDENNDDDDDDDGHEVGPGSCMKLNPSPPPPCLLMSSDETDSSTTSNPREKLVTSNATSANAAVAAAAAAAAPYRIDTEVLKKMNRILTQLERKANNLERKFNLNRSLSLNYKTPKALECCCCGHHHEGVVMPPLLATALSSQHHAAAVAAQQQQPHCYQQLLATGGSTGAGTTTLPPCQHGSTTCMHVPPAPPPLPISLRSRLSLTKDEKTDKNINRRRQIHDIHLTGSGLGCVVTNAAAATAPANSSCCGSSNSTSSNSSNSSSSSTSSCCCDNRSNGNSGSVITVTPHTTVTVAASCGAAGLPMTGTGVGGNAGRQRRHAGSRSIRRRHTVGGTHDYLSNKMNVAHQHHHTPGGPDCCPMPRN